MAFKGFRKPIGASYEYAEGVHPTGFIGGDAASRRAVAREPKGGSAGDEVGGGSDAVGFVCIDGVLVSGFAGACGSVVSLLEKPPPHLLSPLLTEIFMSAVAKSNVNAVPDVIGMPVLAACRELRPNGYTGAVVGEVGDGVSGPSRVVAQEPEAGREG